MLARGARAGVQVYLINLLNYLPRLDPTVGYRLFYNGFKKVKLDFPWVDFENVRIHPFSFPNRFVDLSIKIFGRPRLDRFLGGTDLFFSPHFFSAPLSRGVAKITTFHDLSFEREPRFFSLRQRIWHWQVRARNAARSSAKLIAVSKSTKQDMVNLYKIKAEKIEVVHSGIDPAFRILSETEMEPEKNRLREKYGLPENFILYVGTIEPRKNIGAIIKAFNFLKRRKEFADFGLVLAGGFGWLFGDILQIWRSSPFRDDIKFTGSVWEDRMGLYNLAKIFVYPSFFEGFGFPPLEAMACGTPAIVSHSSSLPEVVGEAAILVDPYKVDEIYAAMKSVLED
jgi:glycosyltransferase involved in cell wall biosynthesis